MRTLGSSLASPNQECTAHTRSFVVASFALEPSLFPFLLLFPPLPLLAELFFSSRFGFAFTLRQDPPRPRLASFAVPFGPPSLLLTSSLARSSLVKRPILSLSLSSFLSPPSPPGLRLSPHLVRSSPHFASPALYIMSQHDTTMGFPADEDDSFAYEDEPDLQEGVRNLSVSSDGTIDSLVSQGASCSSSLGVRVPCTDLAFSPPFLPSQTRRLPLLSRPTLACMSLRRATTTACRTLASS